MENKGNTERIYNMGIIQLDNKEKKNILSQILDNREPGLAYYQHKVYTLLAIESSKSAIDDKVYPSILIENITEFSERFSIDKEIPKVIPAKNWFLTTTNKD